MKRMHSISSSPACGSWCRPSSEVRTTTSSVHSTTSTASVPRIPSMVADAATRPRGLSSSMMDSLIRLAKLTSDKLVEEAQTSLYTPMARNKVKLLSCSKGIALFQRVRSTQPRIMPRKATRQASDSKLSLSQSLRNCFSLRRLRSAPLNSVSEDTKHVDKPVPTYVHHLPRVFGRTRVHVTLDELLDVVGHRSDHAASLLHPSMHQTGLYHTLIDCVDEHVCLRSVTLQTPSPTASETRDFLIVEHRHAFETPTGRRGYAIAFHSVDWNQCPPPEEEAVRGSLYESGLVVLETEDDPECVELFCVAEMNLKQNATEMDNYDASYRRVEGTLTRITRTIDERTKMLMSLDHTHVFHKARRTTSRATPTCSDCKSRLRKPSPGTEPYACRKCYAKVCEDCSSIWQRGQKSMRLCMECWADAQLNRTCSSQTTTMFGTDLNARALICQ